MENNVSYFYVREGMGTGTKIRLFLKLKTNCYHIILYLFL